jgi:hypothetical protein
MPKRTPLALAVLSLAGLTLVTGCSASGTEAKSTPAAEEGSAISADRCETNKAHGLPVPGIRLDPQRDRRR